MQRIVDVSVSTIGLLIIGPLLLLFAALIWAQDGSSPFYLALRAGLKGEPFRMVKLRSMVVQADRIGGDSTASNDGRITPIGAVVRRFKLDELTQLWNVWKGDMSLVGPRPNTLREVATYSESEKRLLSIKPGITDFASIVFSDEGDILSRFEDPDLAYQNLIRPFKSRLGLLYIDKQSVSLSIRLSALTLLAVVNRPAALRRVSAIVESLGAPSELVAVALRDHDLAQGIPQ